MSARLHIVVEGQTEEAFVNRVLAPHLAPFGVTAVASCITTSRKGGRKHRGGLRTYVGLRNDVSRWMKSDRNADALFTTMVDLYHLPTDFPAYDRARAESDAYRRVEMLEEALAADLEDRRFLPYIQLHEFEALLLADPAKLNLRCPEREAEIRTLVSMVSGFPSPELIDDGKTTAPSKRIIRLIPEYDGMKVSAGPLVSEKIGLPVIRSKCPHFDRWVGKLECLV